MLLFQRNNFGIPGILSSSPVISRKLQKIRVSCLWFIALQGRWGWRISWLEASSSLSSEELLAHVLLSVLQVCTQISAAFPLLVLSVS